MEMTVKQDAMILYQSKVNLCDKKEKMDMLKMSLAVCGVPDSCPIKTNSTFRRTNVKMGKFSDSTKRLLTTFALVGKSAQLRFKITHDTGISCFDIISIISKLKSD